MVSQPCTQHCRTAGIGPAVFLLFAMRRADRQLALITLCPAGGYWQDWSTYKCITHIMRLLISLWDVGTVFFTIYPQVFRHEKSSIYYKYIEPLSYCFSISFKILIITVYGFMKWYICKCLFCKVYLLDLSYNRNAKPMTGSNELRFNLTQIRG